MKVAVDNLLDRLLAVRRGEDIVLLTDEDSDLGVVDALVEGIHRRQAVPIVARIPRPQLPGAEPPPSVAALLRQAGAVVELTSVFIGSNQARREATAGGARYVAMPAVRVETFRDGGPLTVDFDVIRPTAELLGEAWTRAERFRLTTTVGTDLGGSVEGRPGRVLHGICRQDGDYMAPPDIEAGTAPVEGSANGTVIVDGDLLFMGLGPVTDPVALHFRDGQLISIEGGEAQRLEDMLSRCADPRMSNLAEVSLGLNPAARVCDVPMETEATLGTAHVALGNSLAYGGQVDAVAHLDCVFQNATLELDGRVVMANGELT